MLESTALQPYSVQDPSALLGIPYPSKSLNPQKSLNRASSSSPLKDLHVPKDSHLLKSSGVNQHGELSDRLRLNPIKVIVYHYYSVYNRKALESFIFSSESSLNADINKLEAFIQNVESEPDYKSHPHVQSFRAFVQIVIIPPPESLHVAKGIKQRLEHSVRDSGERKVIIVKKHDLQGEL